MNDAQPRSIVASMVAALALAAGFAAFLIPLGHAGPYGIPGRGLIGGLLCLVIAAVLLLSGVPRWVRTLTIVVSPVILFFALYGALAELEEVVVLHAENAALRLWVVDHEGVPWVSMDRQKAEENALDGARLELMRDGELRCVVPRLFDDETNKRRTFDLRQDKYAVQRLGGWLGMFGDGPRPNSVTLRLDPCE